MDTNSAEALSILDSISISDQTSEHLKARYALLITQARDKNFMFETNDSLISTAVEYFDAHPSLKEQTLAHLYKGVINLYKGNLTSAIIEALTSLDLAEKLKDSYILAKTNELIADIYVASFNFDHAIPHRKLAANYYKKANKLTNEQYALVDLSREYSNSRKAEKAIAILDSISSKTAISDSTLEGYLLDSYIKPLCDIGNYNLAKDKLNKATSYWMTNAAELRDNTYISNLFIHLNMLDSAEYYIEAEKSINPAWDKSEKYHWAKSNLYTKRNDFANAMSELQQMFDIHNTTVSTALKNNVAFAVSDFNYTKSLAEHDKAKRSNNIVHLLILLLFTICITFFIFYNERMKRRRLEIENKMFEARVLASRLNQTESYSTELISSINTKNRLLQEQTTLVNQLFKDRYRALNNLCNEYFEKRDSQSTRLSIITDFENEIAKIRQEDYINQLKDIVNRCRDNILTKIHEQMPQFKENDILFCALILAGFSPRAICLIMDIKLGNYYNKWTRLRARISNSNAPDKEFFLATMTK